MCSCSLLCVSVACVQTSQVMANVEPVDWNHWADNGSPRKPDLCAHNHRVYLCCDGNAAVRHQIYNGILSRGSKMEFRRLPALVHDCVPRAMRRVDRINVELLTLL